MTTTALTVVQRAAVALQSESAAAHLAALAASTKDIGAPTNRAGREQCHAAAMAALKARTAIVTASKAARTEIARVADLVGVVLADDFMDEVAILQESAGLDAIPVECIGNVGV